MEESDVSRPASEVAEDRDFYRWYGTWESLTPPDVARLFAGLPVPWWVVGGWAVDAFTGWPRGHEDIDVAFLRADLPAVLAHLSPDLCVWSNLSGTLRPLRMPEDLLDGARQLWVRRDGDSPWVMDLAVTPHDGETWISPRDDRIRRPLDDATFVGADGIRYLRPELVLFMKALFARSKDTRDLHAVLPRLDDTTRRWLSEAIELVHPGHRWLAAIAAVIDAGVPVIDGGAPPG